MLDILAPAGDVDPIDPILNISETFPPVYIAHGQDDIMVPTTLSRDLLAKLQEYGVKCGMTEIPNEGHTFAARMRPGTQTWKLQRDGFDFLQGLIQTAQ